MNRKAFADMAPRSPQTLSPDETVIASREELLKGLSWGGVRVGSRGNRQALIVVRHKHLSIGEASPVKVESRTLRILNAK